MDTAPFRQCALSRGDERQVAWIPERIAVPGNIVKICGARGWSEGWRVDEVYQPRDVMWLWDAWI